MPSLWFIVPAAGREQLARICLTHLRRTCDELTGHGIRASAVVVADDENLDTARELGFGTVERDNLFVSQKFNDGFDLACNPAHNPNPADYVVPCGSDDWVDWRIFMDLPRPDTIRCFQRLSFVREDGLEMTSRQLRNIGGCGIRVYPRQVVERRWYRPADEDRKRACDTSILHNVQRANPRVRVQHAGIDPRQIVDWKSPDNQLNPYDTLRAHRPMRPVADPFVALTGIYPAEHLKQMRAHYEQVRERDLVAA
jgi:hypothetical protein